MELKPKIGIDNLKFGMSRKEIIAILGEPDRTLTNEDDNNEVMLEWNEKKLRLSFFKDEKDRFGYIRTKNTSLNYNGHEIFDKKIEIVKDEIFGNLINDWEVEDYGFFETHTCEKYWLTLYVEYGIVIDFEIGVPFKNDSDYDWPK
ncbi:MAG: hypothetical protein JXR51_02800 [Bacteroidales bacterium]|nr:hypothetical protein [Bacteroidales bacterium]MBN2756078.1 hypothetical protein [Bacteroidales bacterium]